MRTLLTATLLTLAVSAGAAHAQAPAAASVDQRCAQSANLLSGEAKKQFIDQCVRSGGSLVQAQVAKDNSCMVQAHRQLLSGEALNRFLQSCREP